MTLRLRKRLLFDIGIIFVIWGLLLFPSIIFKPSRPEDYSTLYPFRLFLHAFLGVTGLLTAFGIWFYRPGARTLGMIVSSISAVYVLYWLVMRWLVYFQPGNITLPNGRRAFIYIIYPSWREMVFRAAMVVLFVYIVLFLTHKDTKLIFARKGKLEAPVKP